MIDTLTVMRERERRAREQPTVCAVMLVNGRPEMTRLAIASFRAQTYRPKRLLIWDTGRVPALNLEQITDDLLYFREDCASTIGELRNRANRQAASGESCATPDLIAHFDSDDYSHPRRLEEQVALLQASGKQCVGYRELLFWDMRVAQIEIDPTRLGPEGHGCLGTVRSVGEAWIYRNHQANYATGASFLYRRELWEQQPFEDAPHEDRRWWLTPLVSRNCIGVTGIGEFDGMEAASMDPRMICQLHGSNSEAYDRGVMLKNPDVWRRAPEFDKYCSLVMKL